MKTRLIKRKKKYGGEKKNRTGGNRTPWGQSVLNREKFGAAGSVGTKQLRVWPERGFPAKHCKGQTSPTPILDRGMNYLGTRVWVQEKTKKIFLGGRKAYHGELTINIVFLRWTPKRGTGIYGRDEQGLFVAKKPP